MDGPALWLHADLHPANVLTADGTFCGVIDFGDLCAGVPACDLAAVWLLLPDDTTDHFYAAYQPTPDTATMRQKITGGVGVDGCAGFAGSIYAG
jgi:aminoglycoside phosphotransferase (APT) family kinase protein